MKIKVYRPKNQVGFYDHKNDSFRELLDLWEELDYIELIDYEGKYVWMNSIGDVLLYDRPTLEWLEPNLKYNIGLFGNTKLPENEKNNQHWIFWARHPKILNQNIKTRKLNSTIFIGNVENSTQLEYRDNTWEKVIERYEINLGKEHKYENLEYLKITGSYKYGLCLRGYGQKCHREIELMRFGTVPIFTPECNTDYYNDLQQNVHFIKVSTPDELQQKLESINLKEYKKLSLNCKKWYEKNCSPEGSFQVTMEIVENCKKKINKLESICTLVTRTSENDFIQLLSSIRTNFKNIKLYILCDSYIEALFNQEEDQQCIFINQLDNYKDLNREQMEEKGIWTEFMLKKTDIIDYSLTNHCNTLFVDSDILFLNNKLDINFESQVGLSPHYISQLEQNKYGKYNAGFIYISDKEVTKYWRETDHSDYYQEQGLLNTFPNKFSYFEFDELNNFGFWRLNNIDNQEELKKEITFNDGKHYFRDNEINSLHIHQFESKYNFFTCLFNIPRFTLIVQYYNDKIPERQLELDKCIIENLNNPLFKSVVNLVESQTQVSENIKNHPKYKEFKIGKRITYQDVMQYCNKNLKYETVILGNLDIIYSNNSDLQVCKNEVIALTRVENNTYNLFFSMRSQDSWIFVPPLTINDCDFEIGSLGCDNSFADRVMKSGLNILNRGTKFLNVHVDNVRTPEQKKELYLRNNAMEKGYLLLPDFDNLSKLELSDNDYKIKLNFINHTLSN